MPVELSSRERLRQGLLGPLGEEVTALLMHELDHAGLRAHVDDRFADLEERIDERFAKIDERFAKVDERFEKVDERFANLEREVHGLSVKIDAMAEAVADLKFWVTHEFKSSRGLVFALCGTLATVALSATVSIIVRTLG